MSQVVKPPPAGTREATDHVTSVKVSSMKSMFENPKKSDNAPAAAPPRRRQLRTDDWTTAKDSNQRVVKEGFYEDRGGVVRPPTAGTKERPGYSLSADFLRSRAAMFETPSPQEYKPKNSVNAKSSDGPKEVVNSQPAESDVNYQLSTSLKDTKKMFESGQEKESNGQEEVQENGTTEENEQEEQAVEIQEEPEAQEPASEEAQEQEEEASEEPEPQEQEEPEPEVEEQENEEPVAEETLEEPTQETEEEADAGQAQEEETGDQEEQIVSDDVADDAVPDVEEYAEE